MKNIGLTQSARAGYDATVAAYRQTVLTGFQEVEDNLAALCILRDEAVVQDQAVAAAKLSVELSTNQYKAGTLEHHRSAGGDHHVPEQPEDGGHHPGEPPELQRPVDQGPGGRLERGRPAHPGAAAALAEAVPAEFDGEPPGDGGAGRGAGPINAGLD